MNHTTNLGNGVPPDRRSYGIVLIIIIALICIFYFSGRASASLNESDTNEVLKNFDMYAETRFQASGAPGMAIAITDRNRTIYSRGFGVRTVGKSDPVTPDTVFQIASMSKAFTATLCGILVDEGKLSWNDTVVSRLPEFALKDPEATRCMTIGEVMTHNSGLYPFQGDGMVRTSMSRMERISRMKYLEPAKPFRTGFGYVNLHFLIAGEVIHAVTGISWEENLKSRILIPLGMLNTSCDLESLHKGNNSASLHTIGRFGWVQVPWDWPYIGVCYQDGPAGGINSNVIDYAKWIRMWLNMGSYQGGSLIQENTTRYIIHPENPIGSNSRNETDTYAHGWTQTINQSIPYPIIWHNGGTSGSHSCVYLIPEEGVGIVVLTNYNGDSLPENLCRDFLSYYVGNPLPEITGNDPLYEKVEFPGMENPVIHENVTLDPSRYVGNYSSDIYGEGNISYVNGNLTLFYGPRPASIMMIPINTTTFSSDGWPQIPGTQWFGTNFTFEFGPDGRSTRLIIPGPSPNASPEVFNRV